MVLLTLVEIFDKSSLNSNSLSRQIPRIFWEFIRIKRVKYRLGWFCVRVFRVFPVKIISYAWFSGSDVSFGSLVQMLGQIVVSFSGVLQNKCS